MDINLNRGGMPAVPPNLPFLLMMFGGGAIGLGLLIIFNEELLRWMVASVFLLIGAVLLFTGLRARRMLGG